MGRKCGAEWRDSGKGEQLLDEIARGWKRNEGPKGILVEGGERLDGVLRALDVPHDSRGALVFKRQGSGMEVRVDESGDVVMEEGDTNELSTEALEDIDPRKYLKVVDGFKQPKYNFNATKKQFERFVLSPTSHSHAKPLSDLQNQHSSQARRAKPSCSRTVTISSTNVSCATKTFFPQPSKVPQLPALRNHSLKSHRYAIFSVAPVKVS